MIKSWDIVSNLNAADSSIEYALLIDGTEHDAHLMAKKLQGYAQTPQPAGAPYTYRFALANNLDEDTLQNIRVAVQETVEQSKKISEFAPAGAVGSPLFQTDGPVEENKFPTFITLDPEDTFSAPKENTIPLPQPSQKQKEEKVEITQQSVAADPLPQQVVQDNTPSPDSLPSAAPAADQPVDDIFLAETKYDMFVDVDKLAADQTNKTSAAPQKTEPGADADDVFNIFDQKIKDQTAFIDLSDVSDITERITQKDLDFVKHADVPAPAATAAPNAQAALPAEDTTEEVLDPFEQLLAQASPHQTASVAPASTTQHIQAPETPTLKLTQPPLAKPAPVTEKIMDTEKSGERKTFIRLKSKGQSAPSAPVPPAGPQTPAPKLKPKAAPQTPKPQAPKPQAPKPQTPKPQAPAPQVPAAQAPAPQTPDVPKAATMRMTTLHRRKQAPANTFLDKTHTIDHSIEIPLSDLQQYTWPLEVPLIPTYTLENMTISVNRFAHATAISVIDNPGKLYNPLVLHGTSGTGKTHFLHAIGYALSKKFGQENVFITNGVRLSRGIQRYVTEGKIHEFEEFAAKMKALFIDDIHLISINEQNRVHLSNLLNDFRAQNKQIVITSKYPPENLAKLEELLNFKLDSGWISDLKPARGPARMRIIQQMLANNKLNIAVADANRFFGHPNISLGSVARSIRRARVLEKLIFPDSQTLDQQSMLTIFDQLLATKGEDQSSLISQKSPNDIHSVSIVGKGEWGRIGFFYPQHNSNMMNWLLFALQQRAKELGINGGLELAVRSSYTTDNIISSAFKIANLCDNKKLKGAVILGPSSDMCEPSVRENFYDILTHMLEIMMIRCGVMNVDDISAPSTYVKILSELLK